MNKTTRLKKPQIPELETLYTFDELGGRPKYGGVEMTSETDIPSFQEIMDETHSAVVAEATARDDADDALQAEIDALAGQTSEALENEATARAAADTALQGAINSEASTRGAADNVLQNQIDAIVASSDVKDIVGTKAELDAYDKSTLGDNDIIKVLQDESQLGATTYYRYIEAINDFTLIGSEGPYYTKGQADALLNNKADKATTYTKTEVDATVSGLEADIAAKQDRLTAGENVTIENNVISAKGGIEELTAADYNYPTANPTSIAVWLLDDGVYRITCERGTAEETRVHYASTVMDSITSQILVSVHKGRSTVNNETYIAVLGENGTANELTRTYVVDSSTGALKSRAFALTDSNVKQSTGTSTTDVMSQKAVTALIYSDNDTLIGAKNSVRIGDNISVGSGNTTYKSVLIGKNQKTSSNDNNAVLIGPISQPTGTGRFTSASNPTALGSDAIVEGANGVAVGYGAKATRQGEMNIGLVIAGTGQGYNSSNYRLLTGLYDPQSDHDAATKGYVDTAVASAGGAEEISSQDWSDLWQ